MRFLSLDAIIGHSKHPINRSNSPSTRLSGRSDVLTPFPNFSVEGTPLQRWGDSRPVGLSSEPAPLHRQPPCPRPVTRQTPRGPHHSRPCRLRGASSRLATKEASPPPQAHLLTTLGFLTLCPAEPPPQLLRPPRLNSSILADPPPGWGSGPVGVPPAHVLWDQSSGLLCPHIYFCPCPLRTGHLASWTPAPKSVLL